MSRRFLKFISISFAILYSHLSVASDSYYEQAVQAFHEGKYDSSFIYLKNALEANPKSLPAKILMGKILLHRGYFKESINEFEEALSYRADMNLIVADYTTALNFDKRYKDVLSVADGYSLNRDSRFEYLLNKGIAYKNLDLTSLASKAYQQAMVLKPRETRAINSLAAFELSQGNFQQAESLVKRSLTIMPMDHRAIHLKGRILFTQERYGEAIEAYREALNILDEDPVVRRSLIAALIKTEQFVEADVMIKRVLEVTPEDPHIMLLASWMLSLQKQDNEAANMLESLSSTTSVLSESDLADTPSIIFVTAISSYVQGNIEQAAKKLSRYLTEVPGDLRAISLLANVYLMQDKQGEAVYLLSRHESSVVKDLNLALKLADLYLANGQRFEAESLLNRLNEDKPGELDVVLRLVNILNNSGRAKRANALIEQTKENESSIRLELARGLMYLQSGDLNSAHDIANSLVTQFPDDVEFLNFQSAVLIKLGRAEEAQSAINKVLEARSDFFEAQFNLATTFRMLGQLQEAENILTTLIEKRPDHNEVKFMLGQIYATQARFEEAIPLLESLRVGNSGRVSQEILYDVYFEMGEYQKAYRVIKDLNQVYIFQPKYLFDTVKVLQKLNKLDEAQKQLGVLFGLAEKNTRMLFDIAVMQRQVMDFSGAQSTLNKLLSLIPNNLRVNIEQARLFMASGKLDEAETKALELKKLLQNDANTLLLLGDIALTRGNKESAFDYYWQTLNVDPAFNLVTFNLYQLAKEGIKPNQLTAKLQWLIEKFPEEVWRQKMLADHYINLKQSDLALAIYESLLQTEQYNQDPFVFNNVASIHLDNKSDKALQYALNAYKLNDSNAAILDTLGWAYFQVQRYDDSLSMLRAAHAMNSGSKTVRFHLASVLHKLNRPAEAKVELNIALSGSENETWYQQALMLQQSL